MGQEVHLDQHQSEKVPDTYMKLYMLPDDLAAA